VSKHLGYIPTNTNNGAILRMSVFGVDSGWTKCEKTYTGVKKDKEDNTVVV